MPKSTCSFPECERGTYAKSLCRSHYAQQRNGKPLTPLKFVFKGTELERFWHYTEKTSECWLWNGYIDPDGYGRMHVVRTSRNYVLVHRYAYEQFVGPIPDGLVLDHLCRVRRCNNPQHLEPVSDAENVLRGVGYAATNARKTQCKNGHDFTAENTAVHPDTGFRYCRTCHREKQQERRRKAKLQ